MEEQWTLEKLGGHMYRLHQLWDGTPEMLELLTEKGYRALSEGDMDYYYEFEEHDEHFNFGVSMSECFQELICVRRFQNDFFHTAARNNFDVDFGKQLADNGDRIEMLLRHIDLYGVEHALYQYAANYSKSLAEKALRMHQELDESGFVAWLKENVKPRASLNPEDILRYNIVPSDIFEGLNLPCAFYSSWLCVKENKEAFQDWITTNEIPMKNPAEIFNDCLLHPNDETIKMFALYYWFGEEACACHLFSMLNSQDVSIGVRSFLQNTLIDYGKSDVEFAKQLQYLYDEYRAIIWEGVNIIFYETTETDTTAQQTPQIEGPEQEQPKQAPKANDETRQNLFNASKELIEVIVDFIAENYDEKFIVDYFKRMLKSSKYKNDSMKLVQELANNRSKFEYKGLKVQYFCYIIGFLITRGVIIGKPTAMARKIYPKLDRYPEEKFDPQKHDNIKENRIKSIRSYIQHAKGFFSGKPSKTILGHNFIQQVFDDMPKKTQKKPKTS